VDDHVSVDDSPAAMLPGDAERDSVGTNGDRGASPPPPAGDSSSPPPPQAASTRAGTSSSRCLARKVGPHALPAPQDATSTSVHHTLSSNKPRTSEQTTTGCSAFMPLHATTRTYNAQVRWFTSHQKLSEMRVRYCERFSGNCGAVQRSRPPGGMAAGARAPSAVPSFAFLALVLAALLLGNAVFAWWTGVYWPVMVGWGAKLRAAARRLRRSLGRLQALQIVGAADLQMRFGPFVKVHDRGA
jgi:hypothetical protein